MKTQKQKRTSVLVVNDQKTFDLPDINMRFSGWVKSILPYGDRVTIELQMDGTKLERSKNRSKR